MKNNSTTSIKLRIKYRTAVLRIDQVYVSLDSVFNHFYSYMLFANNDQPSSTYYARLDLAPAPSSITPLATVRY
jgi:hypothetical protein